MLVATTAIILPLISRTVPCNVSSGIARQRLPLVQFCVGFTALALRMGLTNGSRLPAAPIKRGAGFFSGTVGGAVALAVAEGGTAFAVAFFGAGVTAFFVAVASAGSLFFVFVAVVEPALDLLAGFPAGCAAAVLVVELFVAGVADPVLAAAPFAAGVLDLAVDAAFPFTPAELLWVPVLLAVAVLPVVLAAVFPEVAAGTEAAGLCAAVFFSGRTPVLISFFFAAEAGPFFVTEGDEDFWDVALAFVAVAGELLFAAVGLAPDFCCPAGVGDGLLCGPVLPDVPAFCPAATLAMAVASAKI